MGNLAFKGILALLLQPIKLLLLVAIFIVTVMIYNLEAKQRPYVTPASIDKTGDEPYFVCEQARHDLLNVETNMHIVLNGTQIR